MKIKLKKSVGNIIRQASKIVREWNGHLEIFCLPQVKENSRQYVLLRTDILQKTVVGCPCDLRVDSPAAFACNRCILTLSHAIVLLRRLHAHVACE